VDAVETLWTNVPRRFGRRGLENRRAGRLRRRRRRV